MLSEMQKLISQQCAQTNEIQNFLGLELAY